MQIIIFSGISEDLLIHLPGLLKGSSDTPSLIMAEYWATANPKNEPSGPTNSGSRPLQDLLPR